MALPSTGGNLFLWLGLYAVIAAGLILVAVRVYSARTYHFAEVDPGVLYRDGMRHPAQFAASCTRARVRTVVSLIGDDELASQRFAPAMARCQADGIRTLQVAIPLGGWPSSEDIQRFLGIAQDVNRQPVLVHCREGVRRTGMMVSAYRLSVLGYSKEKAKAALETFGHSRRSIGDVERFIDCYDPTTRTVTYTSAEKTVSTNE